MLTTEPHRTNEPQHARVLAGLARRLAGARQERDVCEGLYAGLAGPLDAAAGAVLLCPEGGGEARVAFAAEEEALPAGVLAGLGAAAWSGGAELREGGAGHGPLLLAPLLAGDAVLGGLVLARAADAAPFTRGDADLAAAGCEIAAASFAAVRVLEEARRRERRAEQIEAIARELGASLELSQVVERVAQVAAERAGRPVVVWLVEGERIRAAARAGGALVGMGEDRPLPREAAARLLDLSQAPAETLKDPEVRALAREVGGADRIVVPLAVGGQLVGFVAAGPWNDAEPTAEQIQMLHRMAPIAASALENARLHAELLRVSLTDPLVQLPNRRQLDLFLDREFSAAERGRPLCMVLFDLDRFKEYNDANGHGAGDVALIRFAEVLRNETRAMNLPARYGGEEFAAVLSASELAGGYLYADRVRRRLELVMEGTLTVSAGVAAYRAEHRSPADLIRAADRALYRAKQGGRNRVELDG